jgi:hypothetical protein
VPRWRREKEIINLSKHKKYQNLGWAVVPLVHVRALKKNRLGGPALWTMFDNQLNKL